MITYFLQLLKTITILLLKRSNYFTGAHGDMFSNSSASQMAAAAVAAAYPYTFYTAAASNLYDVGKEPITMLNH